MGTKKQQTCTQGKWCVSALTGHGIQGAILKVFIPRDGLVDKTTGIRCKYQYGESHGLLFPTVELAMEHALAKGYLQVYYSRAHKTL